MHGVQVCNATELWQEGKMFRFQGNLFLLKRLVLCSTDNIDIDMQEMQVGNTTLLRQEGKMVYMLVNLFLLER